MSSESMWVVTLTADDSPLAVCASIVAEMRNQTLNRQHSHSSHVRTLHRLYKSYHAARSLQDTLHSWQM